MTDSVINVLVVEDNPTDFLLLRTALEADRLDVFALSRVERLSEALALLTRQRLDLVLLDLGLPDSQGIDTFVQLHRQFPDLPVVVFSGNSDEQAAIEAVRAGAQDYLVKGQAAFELAARTVRYAIERKRAANALWAEQQRFVRLAETVPGAITMLHMQPAGEFELLYASPAFEAIFGLKFSETNKNVDAILQRIPPEEAQKILAQLTELAATLQPIYFEFRYQHPLKGEVWLENRAQPAREADGSVVWYGVTSDITERKQTEKQRRQWADAFGNCAHGIAIGLPTTNRILTCNPVFASTQGRTIEEIASMPILSMYAPEDQEYVKQAIAEADRVGSVCYEARMIRKDGLRYPVQMDVVSVRDEAGQILYRVATQQDITKRKQAEVALAESEKRFRALIEHSSDGIVLLSRRGEILYESPTVEILTGFTTAERLGKDGFDNVHPADLPLVRAKFAQLIEQPGTPIHVEYRAFRQGGKLWWNESTAVNLLADPAVQGIVVNFRDITERKRAEEKLRESERRFATVFRSNPVPLGITREADYRIVDVNDAWSDLSGYLRDEALGHTSTELGLATPETLQGVRDLLKAQGEIHQYEISLCTRSGQERRLLITSEPFELDGEVYLLNNLLDITERKQAEEKLRESEERLDLVMEGSQLGYWDWNIETGQVYRNARWAEMLGYTLEEVEFNVKQWTDLHHPDDRDAAWQSIQDHLDGKTPAHRIEYRMRTKDGQYKWILDQARVVKRDAQGKPLRMSGTHTDITALKQVEEKLRESEQFLNESQRIAKMGSWRLDPVTFKLDWSENCYRLMGFEPDEIEPTFDLFKQMVHPEDFQLVEDASNSLLQQPRSFEYEYRIIDKTGRMKWLFNSVKPILEGDQVVQFTGIQIDITERKQAEEKLRESEARLRQVLESTQDSVFAIDRDYRLITNNQHHQQVLVETGGQPFHTGDSVLPPAYLPEVLEQWRSLYDRAFSGEEFKWETAWPYRNGQVHTIENSFSPLRDALGAITGALVVIHDITERKQAEEKLQTLTNLLSDGQRIAHIGSFEYDATTQRTVWSEEESRIYGYDPSQPSPDYETMLARSIHPADADLLNRTFFTALQNGTVYELEHRIVQPDGSVRWVYDRAHPYFDEHGQLLRYVGVTLDITERRQMEAQREAALAKLRESEERFSKAFAASPIGINLFRLADGSSVDANDAFLEIIGYSREELIGHSAAQLDLFVDVAARNAWMQKIKTGLEVYNQDARIRRKSGEIRDVLASLELIELNGEAMVLVIATDITNRKQAEMALQNNERILRLFVEHSPAAIAMFDREMRYIVHSHRYLTDYRLGEQNLVGRSHYEVFPEMDEARKEIHRRCLAGEVVKCDEDLLPRVDGTLDWVRYELRPWHEANGEVGGLIFFSEVITERKQSQTALQESETKYRTLINVTTDGVYVAQDEKFSFANPALPASLGYTPEEFEGLAFEQVIAPEFLELWTSRFHQRLAGNNPPANYQVKFLHKLGDKVWFDIRANLITYRGRPAVFGIARDITEQRQAEAKLRQSEEQYRYLFENNPHPMWAYNLETLKFLAVNEAAVQKYGYSRAEFLAMTIADIRPAEEMARLLEDLARPRPALQHSSGWKHKLKDGSVIDVEISSHTLEIEGHHSALVVAQDVTERKKTEAALRGSEERLRMALATTSDGFWIVDANRRFLEINPAYCSMSGYTREELLQMSIPDVEALEDVQATRARIRKIKREGQDRFETRHRRKDGSLFDVEVSVNLLDQTAGLMICFCRDITERKIAEQDAAYRQQLLEKVLHLGKNVTAITDLDTCLRQIYRSVRWELGFDRVGIFLYDAAGKAVQGTYGTRRTGEMEDTSWFRQLVDAWGDWQIALDNPRGMAVDDDFQLTHNPLPDDEMYGVKAHVILAAWAGEKPVALLAVDNLASHRAMTAADLEALQLFASYAGLAIENARLHTGLEQRVQDRTAEIEAVRQRLELATQVASLGVWDWNIKTGQLLWDEQVYAIYGISKDAFQVNMESFLSIIYPEDLANLMQFTQDALANKPAGQVEYRIMRGDGSLGHVKVHGTVLYDAEGQPENVIGVVQDITQEKLAENALRASEAQLRVSRDRLSAANSALEKAARMKDEFMASMSHELRTPLTGILGLSEALQLNTYGNLTEKQGKALKNIEESGRHLLELINDILDLSKIEAGMLELNIEPVSLADVCRASLQLTKGMAHKKRHSVDFSMEPSIIHVRGDARRLKQMLVNLLSNAIKFTPENGSLGLEVRALETEGAVSMTVWDNGIGIAPENLEKLFQPFVQLESSLARQYEGTGLGLSLVQSMAELHGGSVQVESTLGAGSRFTILLPWSPDGTRPLPYDTSGTRSLEKALIVDDSEIDAGQLTRYLRILGMETIVHEVGQGVVEAAVRDKPGVILLDLHLPDQHGFDVLAELKANPATAGIPVVICSVEERRSQALARGAVGYLVKPLTITDLRAELNRVAAELDRGFSGIPGSDSNEPMVFVVDDNEVIIETLCDFLLTQKFRVTAARSGVEMLEVVPDLHPDIILMDIQMPVMDGLEATRRIRSHSDPLVARVPVIALTALAMAGDRERCLAAGANEYLSKPVKLTQLSVMIREMLQKG